jgi:hypothetical protein
LIIKKSACRRTPPYHGIDLLDPPPLGRNTSHDTRQTGLNGMGLLSIARDMAKETSKFVAGKSHTWNVSTITTLYSNTQMSIYRWNCCSHWWYCKVRRRRGHHIGNLVYDPYSAFLKEEASKPTSTYHKPMVNKNTENNYASKITLCVELQTTFANECHDRKLRNIAGSAFCFKIIMLLNKCFYFTAFRFCCTER